MLKLTGKFIANFHRFIASILFQESNPTKLMDVYLYSITSNI